MVGVARAPREQVGHVGDDLRAPVSRTRAVGWSPPGSSG
jgi:hypothetical protein